MPKQPRSARPAKAGDPIAQLLPAWRLWLLGALLGALVGWALFQIAPPAFRAQATVVVDNNLEEAWVYFPDRQLFQFLPREPPRGGPAAAPCSTPASLGRGVGFSPPAIMTRAWRSNWLRSGQRPL